MDFPGYPGRTATEAEGEKENRASLVGFKAINTKTRECRMKEDPRVGVGDL